MAAKKFALIRVTGEEIGFENKSDAPGDTLSRGCFPMALASIESGLYRVKKVKFGGIKVVIRPSVIDFPAAYMETRWCICSRLLDELGIPAPSKPTTVRVKFEAVR